MRKVALCLLMVLALSFTYGSAFAEDKFPLKNVSYTVNDLGTEFIGEVTNNSGTSYTMASFKLSVYDADEKLLDVVDIVINNFEDGQTRSFNGISMKQISEISRFKLQFEVGI